MLRWLQKQNLRLWPPQHCAACSAHHCATECSALPSCFLQIRIYMATAPLVKVACLLPFIKFSMKSNEKNLCRYYISNKWFELRVERLNNSLHVAFEQPLHSSWMQIFIKISSLVSNWSNTRDVDGWLTLAKNKGVLAFRRLILPEFWTGDNETEVVQEMFKAKTRF